MLRYRLLIGVLSVFATASAAACVPTTSNTIESQTTDVATVSEAADEAEDEHNTRDTDDHEGEGGRRELGAHEHGAAALMIAWSGSDVAIDLQTPSYNVLGFEYTPTSNEEKALLMESVSALEAGGLLLLSSDAGCTLVSASVQTTLLEESHGEEEHDEDGHDSDEGDHGEEGHDEDGHDSDEEAHGEEDHDEDGHDSDEEDHGEEGHSEAVHSDIDVSYNLECQAPENIVELDASELFVQFPNFEGIQVQWVSDTQQSAADLTPDNPVLQFK